MAIFIDIHTHNAYKENIIAIKNLTFAEIDHLDMSMSFHYYSIGIHPWEVHEITTTALEKLDFWAANDSVKAIGECGLDKNSKAGIKEQCYYFERQVQISEKYKKSLIIHCVGCFNEIIALQKKLQPTQNWIIHGFRGKPELAKQLTKHGLFLSFGEIYNRSSVEVTPIENICLETDLSSIDIMTLYKEIASIKACLPQELNAACRLLKLYVC